jgi:hypothetical protein
MNPNTSWNIPCDMLAILSPKACLLLIECHRRAKLHGGSTFTTNRRSITDRIGFTTRVQQVAEKPVVDEGLAQIWFDQKKQVMCITVNMDRVEALIKESAFFYKIHVNLLRFGLSIDAAILHMEYMFWSDSYKKDTFHKSRKEIENRNRYSKDKQMVTEKILKKCGLADKKVGRIKGMATPISYISVNRKLHDSILNGSYFVSE